MLTVILKIFLKSSKTNFILKMMHSTFEYD